MEDLSNRPATDPRPVPAARRGAWLEQTPFWALSAVLHLVLLAAIAVFVFAPVGTERGGEPPTRLRLRERPASPPPPRDKPPAPARPSPLAPLPEPAIEHVVPVETDREPPRGEPDRPANFDLSAWYKASAVGAGASPLSGRDGTPIGRRRRTGLRTGGPGVPEVEAALDWLVRHQSPDGSWKARDFVEECATPCRNRDPRYGDGRGDARHDVGVTALAMLALTGSGHTHLDGSRPEATRSLRRAAAYLDRVQVRSGDPATHGRFGSAGSEQWIYDHALATFAMAELLLLSRDAIRLQRPVRRAVELCLGAQNPGRGWRYGVRPGDSDSSVTGWMVLALKTARHARLGIPDEAFEEALQGALAWFEYATAANGRTGYLVPGDEGARLAGVHPEPYPYSKELPCMTAVAVLSRLLGGASRRDPAVLRGVGRIAARPPRWVEAKGRSPSEINLYHWYYGSYALFQHGGKPWSAWYGRLLEALVPSQRTSAEGGADVAGSWDPIGEWGVVGGRVYATAMGALILEVTYRFERSSEDAAGKRAALRSPRGELTNSQFRPKITEGLPEGRAPVR